MSVKHTVAGDPMLHGTNFYFSQMDLACAIDRLNPDTGFDSVHTSHIRNSKRCYRNLLCEFDNKMISLTYIHHSMFGGHIRPTVKKQLWR